MLVIMYTRGLSVLYKMVKGLLIDIANAIINLWNEVGLVFPPQAVKGTFTIVFLLFFF